MQQEQEPLVVAADAGINVLGSNDPNRPNHNGAIEVQPVHFNQGDAGNNGHNEIQMVVTDKANPLQQEQEVLVVAADACVKVFRSNEPSPPNRPNQNEAIEVQPFHFNRGDADPADLLQQKNVDLVFATGSQQLPLVDQRQPMPKRRFSTAGGQLFSVNDMPKETGSDFLIKMPVIPNIIAQPASIQNNFDPFIRIDHLPFALRGRLRAASQDGYFQSYKPSLDVINE